MLAVHQRTALFSFEGTNLIAVRHPRCATDCVRVPLKARFASSLAAGVFKDIASRALGSEPPPFTQVNKAIHDDAIGREILENCIEKNFHVSNMKRSVTSYFP